MNKKYLFAAEADKIQDLLFRSSKLKEVSGGSQMLEEFCKNTTNKLADRLEGEIIISSGGSFRVLFREKEKAHKFGEYLAELYRRELHGTITIGDLTVVESEKKAIQQAQRNLRKAKHLGDPPAVEEQLLYMAICSSCGVGVAEHYKKRYEDEEKNYLCEMCRRKFREKDRLKETFLTQFYSFVVGDTEKNYDFPKDVEALAELEERGYVAYIVADVNDMGVIFSNCDGFEELKTLSGELEKVMQRSLAEPTKTLLKTLDNMRTENQTETLPFIPVLPLIMAGDDLFTLVPAQWALDFSRRFCQEFEKRMNESLLKQEIKMDFPATISAAVIVCKGTLPYSIAYALGEEKLKHTKQKAKDKQTSCLSFSVVTGGEAIKPPREEGEVVASWPAYSPEELKSIVEQRNLLKNLPATRRAQLEKFFCQAEKTSDCGIYNKLNEEWRLEKKRLLSRLDNTISKKLAGAFELFGDWEADWRIIHHRFPDLLQAWDFAYDLGTEPRAYEEVEV